LNLFGWNRIWTSRWSLEPSDRGPRLMLYLQPKDPTIRWEGPEIDCRVRRPSGQVSRHQGQGRSFRGQYWVMYPDDFEAGLPLTSGTYRVTWLEKTRTGKWREVLLHRAKVALPAPPWPSPTQGSAERPPAPRDVGKE
jgi:hypothetical protein